MRYFFEIAYKGTAYAGWQTQPNAVGVQQVVEEKLAILYNKHVPIVGSGRTDAGVHCEQQFFHADFFEEINTALFKRKLNGLLPCDIAIKNILPVHEQAHARFDATLRSYEYRIVAEKNPVLHGLVTYYYKPLNIELLNIAANTLLGEHNFASFCKVKTDVSHFRCTVTEAVWKQNKDKLVFHISANRFLRGMVRALVGTMLDVGSGKTTPSYFAEILNAKNRKQAGMNAPPEGLFLTAVNYPETVFLHPK
ncbi:MAG: tRNA pseudouridine(38-40) synthase TruA [Cyclobacteriaceae bacterium]|nr:tRNA pseudouridine(38-40) synthase TruA [Cyclobacteriaceae bacterium]